MSADEVIEKIQKLSPEEQEKVLEFMNTLESSSRELTSFEAAAKWAMEEHREVLRRLSE